MFQRTLVVFENEKICQKALTYARGLALRMDSEVTLLMLVEMAFVGRSFLDAKRVAINALEERIHKVLSTYSAEFLREGISVGVALRVGNPAQELVKFLAERPPFQAVIWGSGEELPEGTQPRKPHWINKIVSSLECPLLAVGTKKEEDGVEKAKET
jgi:nucleotide-binding universal stress UspA family protein